MRVNLILAASSNGVIGADGDIPWHLPEDLARFKELTKGSPVIMGRKTWDSLPPSVRPLPGRSNLVLTRQADWQEPGAIRCSSLTEALAHCEATAQSGNSEDVWIIGGGQLYLEALPLADRAEVTTVDIVVQGDTFAPRFSPKDWRMANRQVLQSRTGLGYVFTTLRRKPRLVAG